MSDYIITGVTGFRNRGVEALVQTNIEGIKSVHKEANITVLSDTPDYDQIRGVSYGESKYKDDMFRTRKARLIKKLPTQTHKVLPNFLNKDFEQGLSLLEQSKVVIATGGDVFSSDYGDSNEHLFSIELAQRMGKKTVFLAHSIGPFKQKNEANNWKRIAEQADLVTVRESYSKDYLVKELGLDNNKILLTADTAFLLDPPNEMTIDKLAGFYNIDFSKPSIALSISQGIKQFAGLNSNAHFNTWKEIIRIALNELKVQIIIIPHVQERYAFNDDRIVAHLLAKEFDYNPNIKLISGDHSASEYKGLISKANLVIAERMHAAIAGLSTCTPTSVLGYSIKARGIMNDIFSNEAEEKEWIIPVNELLGKPNISSWLRGLWDNRDLMTEMLQNEIPRVKKLAFDNFEMLAKL